MHPRKLLEAISSEAKNHIVELSIDLTQLRELLNTAIDEICTSFAEISAEATLPNEMIDISEHKERLRKISERANEVLTGLQFHDLASQVIERAEKRLEGLGSVVQGVFNTASENQPDDIKLFAEMKNLQQESEALRLGLERKVVQANLNIGDVEIF
jgi:3-isopropylmalate dehydratase small subunit